MGEQVETLPTVNPPAFYTPLLWPFLYVYEGVRLPEKIKVPDLISKSHLDLFFSILISGRLSRILVDVLSDRNFCKTFFGI